MSRKGFVEGGVVYTLVMVLSIVASTGAIFGPGALVPSVWLMGATLGTLHSQSPSVVADFRIRKAIEFCEEAGEAECKEKVENWTAEEILDYIRDDEPAQVRTNGGNFVGGYMNPVK